MTLCFQQSGVDFDIGVCLLPVYRVHVLFRSRKISRMMNALFWGLENVMRFMSSHRDLND